LMQSFSHSTCTKEARHKCASGDREANSTRCPSRKPALCPTTSTATSTAASIATCCAATAGAGSASPPDATAATNCLASAPAAPTAAAGPRTYAQPAAAAISACPQCAPSHSRHDVAAQKQGYVVSVVAGCVSKCRIADVASITFSEPNAATRDAIAANKGRGYDRLLLLFPLANAHRLLRVVTELAARSASAPPYQQHPAHHMPPSMMQQQPSAASAQLPSLMQLSQQQMGRQQYMQVRSVMCVLRSCPFAPCCLSLHVTCGRYRRCRRPPRTARIWTPSTTRLPPVRVPSPTSPRPALPLKWPPRLPLVRRRSSVLVVR
jgi:hypothetical protein